MSEKEISRRDFLKGLAGAAAGIAVSVTLPKITRADSLAARIGNVLVKEEKISYTDSLGREIVLPEKILSVIPSGIYAQTLLIMLCPDKLAALARPLMAEDIEDYEKAGLESLVNLIETGEMFPDDYHDSINPEKLKEAGKIVILDVGSPKDGQCEKFEVVEDETGCVTVFIDGTVGNLSRAFRELGGLLGCEDRAEELAGYVDMIWKEIGECREKIPEDVHIFFAGGPHGTSRHTGYSFQNEVIRMLGFTPVVVMTSYDEKRVDIQSLKEMKTDYIIFNDWDCYENIMNIKGEDYKIWGEVETIKNGTFAVAPGLFQSWIGTPLIQMIGALWLGNVIMPELYNYNIAGKVQEFYRITFNLQLCIEDIFDLLGYASMKTED